MFESSVSTLHKIPNLKKKIKNELYILTHENTIFHVQYTNAVTVKGLKNQYIILKNINILNLQVHVSIT